MERGREDGKPVVTFLVAEAGSLCDYPLDVGMLSIAGENRTMRTAETQLEKRVPVLERELRKLKTELKTIHQSPPGGSGTPESLRTIPSLMTLSRLVEPIASRWLPVIVDDAFGHRSFA